MTLPLSFYVLVSFRPRSLRSLRRGLPLDTVKAAAEFGVSWTALSWIQSYLQDRMQFVMLGQDQSSETTLEVGVPPGIGTWSAAVRCVLQSSR